MEPIKAVGTDYGMTTPQIQAQPEEYDYSSMPAVYDPSVEEKKASASSGAGMKALAALAIAGLALWGGHAWGAKSGKKAAAAAEEAKDALQKRIDDAVKIAEEDTNILTSARKRCNRIKDALNGEIKEAEKKADDVVEEGAEKAEEAAK